MHGLLEASEFKTKVTALQENLSLVSACGECDSITDIYACPADIKGKLYIDELFPLVKYQFEDTYFYGPKDAKIFLTRLYGEYMKLPEIDRRIPHYSRVVFLKDM